MKFPRLTKAEIVVLTEDLKKLIHGKTISELRRTTDSVWIVGDGFCLRFVIFKGIPYLVLAADVAGNNWLPQVKQSRVTGVFQPENDRVIAICLTTYDVLGIAKNHWLYLEFFAGGNVVLVDDTQCICAVLRPTSRTARGSRYTRPKGKPGGESAKAERTVLPQTRREISLGIEEPEIRLWLNSDGQVCGFSLSGEEPPAGISIRKASSLLEALTCFYDSLVTQQTKKLSPSAEQRRLQDAQRKLTRLKQQLAETEKADTFRLWAEVILTNLHLITKGEKAVRLPNPYAEKDENIEIPLDPGLLPEQNAEEYFAKARKLSAARERLKQKIERLRKEIDELKALAESSASAPTSPMDVHQETTTKAKVLPFRHYHLADGWEVFVGKSAATNDELTFGFAKKDDIWFHAWQAAGAHLVLRRPRRGVEPPKEILLRAASLAAYFSKAKSSSKVPVIYTEARYVQKIKGATGKVRVTHEKELMVPPLPPADSEI